MVLVASYFNSSNEFVTHFLLTATRWAVIWKCVTRWSDTDVDASCSQPVVRGVVKNKTFNNKQNKLEFIAHVVLRSKEHAVYGCGNFNLICTDEDTKFPVNTTPVEIG